MMGLYENVVLPPRELMGWIDGEREGGWVSKTRGRGESSSCGLLIDNNIICVMVFWCFGELVISKESSAILLYG